MSTVIVVPKLTREALNAAGEILLDELARQLREWEDDEQLPGDTPQQRAAFASALRRAGENIGREDERTDERVQ